MHLFVTQPQLDGEQLLLDEARVVKYMGRVLRMQVGDKCLVQRQEGSESTRREIIIEEITKKHIIGRILNCKKSVKKLSNIALIVALPNKFSKVELIVQKLTEIGIDDIILWPSQRSLLKTISSQRMQRLQSIALEGVEQCKRWTVPNLRLVDNIIPEIKNKHVVVFDFVEEDMDSSREKSSVNNVVGVVGPEGHFGEQDYAILGSVPSIQQSLGEYILRTETASIVGARYLVHTYS